MRYDNIMNEVCKYKECDGSGSIIDEDGYTHDCICRAERKAENEGDATFETNREN